MPCHTDPAPDFDASAAGFNQTESPRGLYSMTVPRHNGNGIEGHLCMAAKDGKGYFLGPIAYMAQEAMAFVTSPKDDGN